MTSLKSIRLAADGCFCTILVLRLECVRVQKCAPLCPNFVQFITLPLKLKVVFNTSDGHEFEGLPTKAHGKRTSIHVPGSFYGTVTGVKVLGRERATNAEKARDILLLHVLQGKCHLRQSKFVRMLWFPCKEDEKYLVGSNTQISSDISSGKLNKSQREVVLDMISSRPLVLVHGEERSMNDMRV